MKATRVLTDCLVVEPDVYADDRGFFIESWNQRVFSNLVGRDVQFVQDNHSRSARNVLRGLHYQTRCVQAKLVRVVSGAVLDVAVDLRDGSPTFGQWHAEKLTDENKKQFWIPEGFAHGFFVLSEFCDFVYKTTTFYDPESEEIIRWNDPVLNIDWGQDDPIPFLSNKDAAAQPFSDAPLFKHGSFRAF